ncbi:T9SS C-terminal target domain-containing protein [candidate division KSB1 bacterium]|nr:MAG: T9SS C-terminal target domain-containing protein [candidate division KSB1 bacterium]
MKTFLAYSLVVILLNLTGTAAAENWRWVNPIPTGNNINEVSVAGIQCAWIVDDAGIVMHSSDGGLSWTQQDVPVQIGWATLTFVDSLYGWVAGGIANPGENGIIIHTSNGGRDWIQQTGGINHFIRDVDFVDRNHGWVIAQSRFDGPYMIISTINGGILWDTLAVVSGYALYAMDFVNATKGWAVGKRVQDSACVLYTADGGGSWTEQLILNDTYFGDLCFLDSLNGWATSSCGLVFHTTNGGLTWSDQLPPITIGGRSRILFRDAQHGWIVSGTGTRPILTTSDGGQSWIHFQSPTSASINSIASWDFHHAVAVGAHGYIFVTNDEGANWTETSYRRDWAGVCSGVFSDSMHGWLIGGISDGNNAIDKIWCTTDGGQFWMEQSLGINTSLKSGCSADANTVWLLGHNGIVLHTDNGGAFWQQQTALSGRNILNFDFHDTFNGAAVEGNSIFITSDGGESWSEYSSTYWGSYSDVAYADALNIWAVGSILVNADSFVYAGVVNHSGDAGFTWTQDTLEGFGELIHVTFGNPSVGFITEHYGRRLLKTVDGGTTWIENPNPCRNVIDWINATNASDIWAVTDLVEIVHSTDGGSTWTLEPLMYAHWLRTLVAPDPRHVWAIGTDGCVFRYGEILSPVPDNDKPVVATTFSVSAYPNPFNPQTTIAFDLPADGRVILTVYDLTGRIVEKIVDGVLPRGSHTLTFDGSKYASGIYFAQLQAGHSSRVQKLMLLK